MSGQRMGANTIRASHPGDTRTNHVNSRRFIVSQTSVTSNGKPRFSAGLVTLIVTLIWLGVFAYFMLQGAKGFQ